MFRGNYWYSRLLILVSACCLCFLGFTQLPAHADSSFTVTKTASPGTVVVGEPITYTITITADDFKLKDVSVDDPKFNVLIDPPFPTTIPKETSVERTFTYTPTKEDIGKLKNTVSVTATPDKMEPETVTASATVTVKKPFTIKKKADVSEVEVGQPIQYTISITAGPKRLNNVTVDDSRFNSLIDPPFPTTIPRNTTVTRTFTYTPKKKDIGKLKNTVTVTATPDKLIPFTEKASVTVLVIEKEKEAKIDVEKVADTDVSKPGDIIHYTITVTNTGEADLVDVEVIDSLLGDIGDELFETGVEHELLSGESVSATIPYLVPKDAPNPLVNTVKASALPEGKDKDEDRVFDEDQVSVLIVSPKIKVTKKADRSSAAVGETITYTIKVKNTGDIGLENIKVVDSMFGNITKKLFGDDNTLMEGDSVKATFQHTVVCSDVNPLTNTVKVSSNPEGLPNVIKDSATATVTITGTGGGGGTSIGPDLGIYNSAYANKKGGGIINTTAQGQVQYQCTDLCVPIIYPIRLENRTGKTVTILITGSEACAGWKVVFKNAMNGGTDITDQVTGSGWNPSCSGITMGPGKARDFIVIVKPGSRVHSGDRCDVFITATVQETGQSDTVEASTTAR